MLEKDIEKYLCDQIKKVGGTCEKFTSPNKRFVPDRLITLPFQPIFFVECKAPKKKPTEAQERDHQRRRDMGVHVYVIDSKESVDTLLLYRLPVDGDYAH